MTGTCEKCGARIGSEREMWAASVTTPRGGGRRYVLCMPCAMAVNFAVQAVIRQGKEEA